MTCTCARCFVDYAHGTCHFSTQKRRTAIYALQRALIEPITGFYHVPPLLFRLPSAGLMFISGYFCAEDSCSMPPHSALTFPTPVLQLAILPMPRGTHIIYADISPAAGTEIILRFLDGRAIALMVNIEPGRMPSRHHHERSRHAFHYYQLAARVSRLRSHAHDAENIGLLFTEQLISSPSCLARHAACHQLKVSLYALRIFDTMLCSRATTLLSA